MLGDRLMDPLNDTLMDPPSMAGVRVRKGGEFSFQVQDPRRSCGITSRVFRTFFLGSPGQVLLCLKSGHHGRLSRTHGPDVYFGFW